MAKHRSHRAELDKLAAELTPAARDRRQGAGTAAATGDRTDRDGALELERLIRELQHKLADAADDVEEIVTAHPVAMVASAFLLGIAIGRMMGRR
jgi:ElaB/YqjD/DUF883 family membrane-anchored ribosome-binding protein